jgi:hypothetical protein
MKVLSAYNSLSVVSAVTLCEFRQSLSATDPPAGLTLSLNQKVTEVSSLLWLFMLDHAQ